MNIDRETVLIEQLRTQGSSKALAALYDLYAPRLFTFCLRMSKSREDAEEIVQDCFVWLWNHRASLPPQKTLSTILFLRTRHLLINLYRARLNSPHYKDYLACCEIASSTSASDEMDYNDLLSTLNMAMAQVTETQQKVIRMVKFDGIAPRKVSETLGITEQTVRNQLSIGLKQIRLILGKGAIMLELVMMLTI